VARFPAEGGCGDRQRPVVYSRYGYGQSDVLSGPRAVDYMHVEALEVLPELLERLGVGDPVLVAIPTAHRSRSSTRRRATASRGS